MISKATPKPTGKYGARVFLMEPDIIYVVQTFKRGAAQNDRYVIDMKNQNARKFVDVSDDKAIADAVRATLEGKL